MNIECRVSFHLYSSLTDLHSMNESPLTFKRSRVFIVELVMHLYALGGNVAHYH